MPHGINFGFAHANLQELKPNHNKMLRYQHLPLILIIAISYTLQGCVTNPVTGRTNLMLMSKEQEIAMGRDADPQIVAEFGLYEDEKLQQLIDRKGQEMAAISHRPDLNYEFKIVDSPVVNAFAVPGGYVYFTRGIMAHFNNEAEFAGVLGHEIGHIAARHSAQQYSKSMIAELGLAVGSALSDEFRQFSDLASQGVGLLFLKYSRDHERQSDKLGVEYSIKTGYNAHKMAEFFKTLDRMQGSRETGTLPEFLSSHPLPANRYKRVLELADEFQAELNATNLEVNRDRYLELIDGLVYGADPKQGYVAEGVFYHPVMKFRFPIPAQWQVNNTPSQVQMAPPNGEAILILGIGQGSSPQEAASNFAQQNQLQVIDTYNTQINGFQAVELFADQQQQNEVIRLGCYFIAYGGTIFQFVGVSRQKDFNQLLPVFNATARSFAQLTDPARINVQPERIRVREVGRSATLESALRNLGVPQDRLQEVAIVNSMMLDQQIAAGTKIKVIE
jgi:predicted Zn-dependent protease